MSKTINFYTISFMKDNCITDYKVIDFFEAISNVMFEQNEHKNIDRKISDKWIRLFSYYYSINRNRMVIPFGKSKDKNKPYWLTTENNLEEIPEKLYDINSLGYDNEYNVMLYTTNREGPSVNDVQSYLNSFIPADTGLQIVIEPIKYNTGIEKIRKAELVRHITLNLDLGQTLNNFYLNEIQDNEQAPLIKSIKKLADTARDNGDSKVLSLSLGLGKNSKRADTLNLESMLSLLDQINIGGDFVKEIEVKYKDGQDEKLDVARIKESQMFLGYKCTCEGTQVSPNDLLNNITTAVSDKVTVITKHLREYYKNSTQYIGDEIKIKKIWHEE